MTSKIYICDEPCPFCGSEVQVYGSDCYPEDGITFECINEKCNYIGDLSCNKRVNCLLNAAKIAHNFISKNISKI